MSLKFIARTVEPPIIAGFWTKLHRHITEKIDECETELGLYDQYVTMSNSPGTGGVTLYLKNNKK